MSASVAISFAPESLAWTGELANRLSALREIVPRPVEIVELLRDAPRGAAAFNAKTVPTGVANEFRIVLEPCDALLRLMAALRAGNWEHDLVAEPGSHARSSIGVGASMVGESGRGESPSPTGGAA